MPNTSAETILPPFTTFRFEVVLTLKSAIAGVQSPVCDASFQECNGLDMTMEPKTMVQGGEHYRQNHRIGAVSYGRLTLRRGMTSNHHLWYWFTAASRAGANRTADGEIRLMNADGSEALTFVLDDCLPVKVSGPSLNAKDGQIAIEELQLVYAELRLKGQGSGATGANVSAGFSASASASLSANASFSVEGGTGFNASASASFDASGSFEASASAGLSLG